jgi:hypothetical protein
MKKIAEFEDFNLLTIILRKIQEKFPLTDFGPVIDLLHIAGYSTSVKMAWSKEESCDKVSHLSLSLVHGMSWGTSEPCHTSLRVYFKWITGSNHVVKIAGNAYGEGQDVPTGKYKVSVGDDASEYFYASLFEVIRANLNL